MGKRINCSKSWHVITGAKSKKLVDQKDFLNLQPRKQMQNNSELDVWSAEVKSIMKLSKLDTVLITDLISEAVVQKLALEGHDKEEIINFLKFYLESDPTIFDKF